MKGNTKMKHTLLEKIIIIGLLITVVSASIASGLSLKNLDPTKDISRGWIYVGGTGPGNYSTIQEGINASSAGDTVFVYQNTYNEHSIVISKNIQLIGENKYSTVINGDGHSHDILMIPGNHVVSIRGFTIQNGGFGIATTSSHTTISNNILKLNSDGIMIMYSSYNTITKNTITQNNFRGLRFTGPSTNNTISANTITSNGMSGIDFYYGSVFSDNIISNNVIQSNSRYGISLMGSCHDNIIVGNTIRNNNWKGLVFSSDGSSISRNNHIYHNNFIDNSQGNAYDGGTNNIWDNGYPGGGNHWSSYTGPDANNDGIGDTNYFIPGGAIEISDRYPLIHLFVLGDTNVDGVVNFADIDPFVLALSDPVAYQTQYHILTTLHGDCNQDGVVNFADIDPFVALIPS
jgi:parallel beta-helix repeat protein